MAAAEPVPLGNTNGDETFAIRQESMDVLDERHHQILSRAINRILYTDEAELTYAQIVDGLPLYDVACDRNPDIPRAGHPLEKHTQLCPGVLDKTKSFRDSFDPNILTFDSRVSELLKLTVA
jgi:hypothetical protein